jgi:hypothetical protein
MLLSFSYIARRLGTVVSPADDRIRQLFEAPATQEQICLAREVSWAVNRAARNVPFRAVCLPQAMAARVMLERRLIASVLHFGAVTGGRCSHAVESHAWVDASGVAVTGYPVARSCIPVACFL